VSTLAHRLDRRWAHEAPGLAQRLDRLPARPRVTFLAEGGSGRGLSVWAASLLLHRDRPDVHQVWACHAGVDAPTWATRVEVGSGRHRWLAARSVLWLTDGWPMRVMDPEASGIPLARGPRTVVAAVVDPSLERVGANVVDWPLLPRSARRLPQQVDRVLVPSSVAAAQAERGWGFEAPCTVAPFLADAVADRAGARQRLGLAADVTVVAWHLSDSRRHDSLPVAELTAALPGVSVQSIAAAPDPVSLVAAADVVIGDTGWPVPSAAAAGHGVVIYAPDVRDGRSRGPGLVTDWPAGLPVAAGAAELAALVDERRAGPVDVDREPLARLGALASDGDPRGAAAAVWDELLSGRP
jgi:hypothetical protein